MSTITYLLLYQVFSHLLVLALYDWCLGKYNREYLFQMQTRQAFFKFL